MTQNPHMKKNIDLREHEMLMNITSERLCCKVRTGTAESGNCGCLPPTPAPPCQKPLISPCNPRTPHTHVTRAPLELQLQSLSLQVPEQSTNQATQKCLKYSPPGHIAHPRVAQGHCCLPGSSPIKKIKLGIAECLFFHRSLDQFSTISAGGWIVSISKPLCRFPGVSV